MTKLLWPVFLQLLFISLKPEQGFNHQHCIYPDFIHEQVRNTRKALVDGLNPADWFQIKMTGKYIWTLDMELMEMMKGGKLLEKVHECNEGEHEEASRGNGRGDEEMWATSANDAPLSALAHTDVCKP